MLVLSDAELGLLGKAFDRAWDKYLRAGVLTPQNLFETRQLLAARILRSAYFGERDEWHLARDAVSYLWQVKNFGGSPAKIPRPAGASVEKRPRVVPPGENRLRAVRPRQNGGFVPVAAP